MKAIAWRVGAVALLVAAAAPSAPQVITTLTIFAGTPQGPRLSRNWGGSWEPLAAAAGTTDPSGVGVARVFYPVGPRVYMGGAGGLFVSEDFGETWRRLYDAGEVRAVLPSRYPQADPTLFIGTTAGLLRSDDWGESWQETGLGPHAVSRIEWPGPALVVATDAGVFVSKDSGRSFTGPGEDLPEGRVEALALSTFFAADPVAFAAVAGAGVFRTPDGGAHWLGAGLEGLSVTDLVWLGPLLYAVSAEGVYRSQDLGETWEPLNEGLEGRRPVRILFPLAPASGVEAFLATDRGVLHTATAGQNWEPSGLEDSPVLCLATFPPPAPELEKVGRR
jgi:photosystem II stability/assembly factor-like uncharacterized protein